MLIKGFADLSEIFGGSRAIWKKRIAAGMPVEVLQPANAGKPHEFDSIAVHRWLVAQATGRPGGDLDPQQERALLDRARRREVELRLQEREGVLIPADRVEETWIRLVHTFRARMLILPSKLSPLLARESDAGVISGIIEGMLYEAMTELSEADVEPFQPEANHEPNEPPLPAADEIH